MDLDTTQINNISIIATGVETNILKNLKVNKASGPDK